MNDTGPHLTISKTASTKAPIPPAIKFVLATMVINAIGFGIIVPVVPRLLMELSHAPIDRATAIGGFLSFTFAITQFFFSPILGNLSDRFGRRPILLGSLAGFSIDFFVLALAPTLTWVFIARAVSGMFGASNGPAQSVIADITAPEDRSRFFGLLGASFGIGFVLGPAIGGLLGEFGHRVPFFVAGTLAACNVLYGHFNLPETLKPENRRPFDWRRANPVGALLHVRKLPGILPISTIYFLWQLSSLVYPMTWAYFAIGRYGWTSGMVGASLAGVGLCMALAQIKALPRFVARFGERRTATIGITGAVTAMIGYAAATQSWMAIALLPLMASQSLVQPNLTAMMTRRADATTQGEVQGFASGIMALGSLVAPLLFNPLLAWFTSKNAPFIFHGAAFVLAALLGLACVPILLAMRPAARAESH
jgi:MFS transporter, DHA1 family, tetracycline resistance protein